MAAFEMEIDDSKQGDDAFEVSEEKKTSLDEIKALLDGVQQMLLEMQNKNRKMADELTELKSSFKKHSMEIGSLKTTLKKAHSDNNVLKKLVDSLKLLQRRLKEFVILSLAPFVTMVIVFNLIENHDQ